MNEPMFWDLIEAARRDNDRDCESQAARLIDDLAVLSESEIVEFSRIMDELMVRSYSAELWAAAYLINGGCSDDGFDYFRGWLMAQGRSAYYNALRDPESLLDTAEPEVECESILYVAAEAYELKTGSELLRQKPPNPHITFEEWTNDWLKAMYPRLYARFGG